MNNNKNESLFKINLDNTPIYRIDILKEIKKTFKKDKAMGLCYEIVKTLQKHKIYSPGIDIIYMFPLFTFDNAKNFGAKNNGCWWKPYKFSIFNGRKKFLNWLIKQYKNDKTNLVDLYNYKIIEKR